MKKYILLLVLLAIPQIALSAENDDDFLLSIIPAIIAPQKCDDPSLLTTCHSPRACEKAEGYWYEKKCNTEPYALHEIRKLAGTWIFQYTYEYEGETHTSYPNEYMFNSSTIRKNPAGEYQISGADGLYSGPITARYIGDDVILVEAPEYQTTGTYSLKRFPSYWAMSFVNSTSMAGVEAWKIEYLDNPYLAIPAFANMQ